MVRKRIIAEGSRVDGRQLDEVRPLYCEAGYISNLHGSAVFSRGETQVKYILFFLLLVAESKIIVMWHVFSSTWFQFSSEVMWIDVMDRSYVL